MHVAWVNAKKKKNTFFISNDVHPQTIDVVQTRASGLDVKIVVGDAKSFDFSKVKKSSFISQEISFIYQVGRRLWSFSSISSYRWKSCGLWKAH